MDKIGTLEDAIRNVANKAKTKDYEVRVYPEPKSFIEVLVEQLSDGDRDFNHLAVSASTAIPTRASSLLDIALPQLKGLDGQRLTTVKAALRQLDLLQQETRNGGDAADQRSRSEQLGALSSDCSAISRRMDLQVHPTGKFWAGRCLTASTPMTAASPAGYCLTREFC